MRPYLRVANVYEDRIDTTSVLEMNFTPEEFETYRLECGDVLLNEGQSLHLVGRPAIYRGEVPGACFQNTLVRFRPYPGLRSEFALMVFRGYLHTQRFIRIARWTTNIAHLGAGRFAEIEFPLAPFPEQERIVEAVESYLTRLDAAVKTLERVQANLRRYRASVLKAAVEGRLVPTEAELARAEGRDYEPASVLLKRILEARRQRWKESGKRGRYKEPVEPDIGGLPELPEGWCWATLDQLSLFITSGSRGWAKFYSEDGPLFIRAQNLKTDALLLDDVAHVRPPTGAEGQRTRVEVGDLLVTITGANVTKTGYLAEDIGEAYVSQHVGLCRPVEPVVTPWLYFWVVAPTAGRARLEDLAYGAGKPGLNLTNLRELPVAIPPIEEQFRLRREVERLLSVASSVAQMTRKDGVRCSRLRQSILKWAFEGKLADQDPADEPASVLLERIRAERKATKPKKGTRRGRLRSRA